MCGWIRLLVWLVNSYDRASFDSEQGCLGCTKHAAEGSGRVLVGNSWAPHLKVESVIPLRGCMGENPDA